MATNSLQASEMLQEIERYSPNPLHKELPPRELRHQSHINIADMVRNDAEFEKFLHEHPEFHSSARHMYKITEAFLKQKEGKKDQDESKHEDKNQDVQEEHRKSIKPD